MFGKRPNFSEQLPLQFTSAALIRTLLIWTGASLCLASAIAWPKGRKRERELDVSISLHTIAIARSNISLTLFLIGPERSGAIFKCARPEIGTSHRTSERGGEVQISSHWHLQLVVR